MWYYRSLDFGTKAPFIWVFKWSEWWYLLSTTFHVHVHDNFSTTAELRCEVLQGFILGPLLFLLYISNMQQAIDWDRFLYEDDTVAKLTTIKDLDEINKEVTKDFL